MTMIREAEFDSRLSYTLWLQKRKDEITILSESGLYNDFFYEASARLETPKIKVTYVDFLED